MAFANPFGLALLGSIAVLVLFYLRQRRRQVEVVPSLLLWEDLKQDLIRSRRFQPTWLFVLQLLALAALSTGLAQPLYENAAAATAPRSRVLVIDTTASTQATDVRTSRFAQLQQQALARLAEVEHEAEVALIDASRRPKVEQGPTRDHGLIAAKVSQLVATDLGGNLQQAIDLARERFPRATIEVFTDANGAAQVEHWPAEVEPFVVGASDDNLGIVSLDVAQGRFDDLAQARVTAQVKNYGSREQHALLSISVAGQIILRRGFTLAAGATENVVLRDLPEAGPVVAALEGGDSLAADDVAFGWLATRAATSVWVGAEPSALREDLANLCRRLNLRVEVGVPGSTPTTTPDLAIFYQHVPSTLPQSHVLFLFPASDNPVVRVVGEVERAEVLDWNQHHPVFDVLRPLPALPFARSRIFETPAWADELLWSRTETRQFPLAVVGERDGRRVAVLGFDLQSEGLLANDRVDRVLLLTAFLSWLLPPADQALITKAGQAVALPTTFAAGSVHPLDRQVGTTAAADVLQPDHVGAYQVKIGDRALPLFVNAGDSAESAIGVAAAVGSRESVTETGDHRRPSMPLQAWFYGVALVLLCLEWLASRRRPA